jgi:adenylate cyclase
VNAVNHFSAELRYTDKIIAFADVVESVRLIERDEAGAVQRISRLLGEVARGIVAMHGGVVLESRGDGLVLEFPDARAAVACAARLHAQAHRGNSQLPVDDQIRWRIGVHCAGVFAGENALFGRGVNLAARITSQASAGGTIVSAAVAGQLVDGLDGRLEDLGACYLKHVTMPVHLYRVRPSEEVAHESRGPGTPMALNPTIAVMPFVPYREDGSGFGIGDILADQVIGALARSNAICVISRLSTTALRGRDHSVRELAELLHADFIVSGRFFLSGKKVTVQAELASAETSQVVWADTVSDSQDAALHIDSMLIGALVNGIASAIFGFESRRASCTPLPNLASHTLLLAAICRLYRLSQVEFDQAHAALLALHERAPRHPTPLAWLARWHLFRVVQGWSSDRDRDGQQALSYAQQALDIDPESSLALTMAGNVHTSYLKDLDAAERMYDAALASNPNESLTWLQKGNERSFRGDGKGALAHIEKALSLSPFDPSRHFYESLLASAALTGGDYERAISAAKSSLRLNSQHISSHRVLAIAQSLTGRTDEAAATVRHILQLEPGLTVRDYVARSPGGRSGLAELFGDALHAAGLPLGGTRPLHIDQQGKMP